MKFAHVTAKGVRPTNEDAHYAPKRLQSINLFGIFDGHGGADVSKYLAKTLIPQLRKSKRDLGKSSYWVKTFEKVNEKIEKNAKLRDQGSTAVICCLEGKRLLVANTGDSRAVLCRHGLAIPLSKDHKPDSFEEGNRIKALGGRVTKPYGVARIAGLSVSRSFGDFDCKPYVVASPDVVKMRLTKKDQFIVMACDGLWDVVSNQEAIDEVMRGTMETAPKRLIDMAMKKKTQDNVSVMILWGF